MTPKCEGDFIKQVVSDILAGLRLGLSKFSGPSRVAAIYRLNETDPFHICDPHDLLRGHETRIRTAHFDQDGHLIQSQNPLRDEPYNHIKQATNLELDGLITYGAQSGPVLYQRWFTEHHPEIISIGPTERWLEHTALRFSHDIANQRDLYSGISGRFLSEYATHAVYDHISRELHQFPDRHNCFDIYPILNAILGISRTREESKSPHGELIFVDPHSIGEIDFLARFEDGDLPPLDNAKHVRKLLLTVQKFRNRLISDGKKICGIARGRIDQPHIAADFRGLFGFLRVNDRSVCSFADGTYSSKTHQARLYQVEEALLDYDLDNSVRSSLFHIVSSLVHYAESEHFGCTVVLDMTWPLIDTAGQNLEFSLDLERSNLLDLACDLSRVDGALHIGVDRHLHRFACLLDGPAIAGEDRARGARYNSALRFTARYHHAIIIVVSADRPVSVIRHGREYGATLAGESTRQCRVYTEELGTWLVS